MNSGVYSLIYAARATGSSGTWRENERGYSAAIVPLSLPIVCRSGTRSGDGLRRGAESGRRIEVSRGIGVGLRAALDRRGLRSACDRRTRDGLRRAAERATASFGRRAGDRLRRDPERATAASGRRAGRAVAAFER